MVNVKLIVCGYHRKYSINHVKWKDLPTVAERLIGFLEGHIGEFSRDTDYDEEYTIAYRSNLPEDTNENAILYALDEVVDCFLNPELGIRVARYQDSSYAGCQWWHIKQNSYISTQMFFSALQGKEAYNLPDLKSERCPDCDCSWDDPNANNRDQEIRLFENKTSYEKSWYRYRDILEGRMDYIDGELITLDNGNQDGDDDAGYGSDGNIDQDHGDIESRIKSMIMEEGVDDEEVWLTFSPIKANPSI